MGIFDFLFKKKEDKKVDPVVNLTKDFIPAIIIVKNEDGTTRNEEYTLAKNICNHLKVAGTKYYQLSPSDYTDRINNDIRLYLRCRFYKIGKDYVRESLKEQLIKSPAVGVTFISGEAVAIDLEVLLKGNIDYVLMDKDEETGKIFHYFSFKGVKDKHDDETAEGYLVINDKDKDIIDYLYNLM